MQTQNLGGNAGTWFEMGRAGGSRLSGVGQSLKVLIDTLKQDRELNQKLAAEKELVRYKAETEAEYRDPLDVYKNKLGVLNLEGIIGGREREAERKNVEDWAYGVSETPPESVLGKVENIRSTAKEQAPVITGPMTEVGMVGAPFGSYKKNGVIYDASGKEIGSYLEGEGEPEKSKEIQDILETSGIEEVRKSLKSKIQARKFGGDQDYKDSLADWAAGAVDDDTAFDMMLQNFPDKAKEIGEFYFLRTGKFRPEAE